MVDTDFGLEASVPEPIRAFVVERVEPVFAGARRLLVLPREADGQGVEAVTLPALFSVLGGLSRVFFHAVGGDRPSFLAVAERYPTADEPAHAIKDAKAFGEALHAHYQASLVHGLGLHARRDSRYEPWRLAPLRFAGRDLRLAVERQQSRLAGDALGQALDAATGWPTGVGPTLSLTSTALRLEVDAFYCGLRRLVRSLAGDHDLHAGALKMLASWHEEHLRSEAERATAILAERPSLPPAGTGPRVSRLGESATG